MSHRGLGKKLNYCNGLGELWSDFQRSIIQELCGKQLVSSYQV